jgi:hypothetical protein
MAFDKQASDAAAVATMVIIVESNIARTKQ